MTSDRSLKATHDKSRRGEIKQAMQIRQSNTLKNLILYFAAKVSDLQDVKLNKLLYVAHLYHYATHGELLTMTRFFCRSFGPYAPVLRMAVQEILASDQIYLMDARTSEDPIYSNPCKVIRTHLTTEYELTAACLHTLQQVLEDWGARTFHEIIDYTNRTIPFLSTVYREQIDLALLIPSSELKKVLSMKQRDFIHRFVDAADDKGWKEMVIEGDGPISIQEIAEIYLALRGNRPETFPSAEHLGFDGQKTLKACQFVTNGGQNASGHKADAVDLTARLILYLIDSMAFRQYTGKVALLTGMLFLMKQGYSFHDEVMEHFWLQEFNYDNMRQWLMRLVI